MADTTIPTSDIPDDWRERLNIREQIARIDRNQAEIHKLLAEQPKLQAERDKLNRDPWLLAFGAIVAAFAVIIARLPELMRAFGWAAP